MSAKIQRRFKNCKEIKDFFVREDYLTIFANCNGYIIYRAYPCRQHGRHDA